MDDVEVPPKTLFSDSPGLTHTPQRPHGNLRLLLVMY